MNSKRRADVQRIERSSGRCPAPALRGTGPEPDKVAPRSRIEEARRLGLTVSSQVPEGVLQRQLEEFECVGRYVRDVWELVAGADPSTAGVSREDLDRFVAGLFEDDQFAGQVVAAQRMRDAAQGPALRQDALLRRVKKKLRAHFKSRLRPRSIWGRLFG